MKIIKIKDYYGKYQEVPVTDEFYKEWVKLANEYQRGYRRDMYHRSGTPFEEVGDTWITGDDPILENYIRDMEVRRLYEAISMLTPTQQRRIRMLMDGMSYTDIARAERCALPPVYRSLQSAFKRLRRLLED